MEVGGVLFFCCFLQPLHDSLATENDCSGNDGAGKLFSGLSHPFLGMGPGPMELGKLAAF